MYLFIVTDIPNYSSISQFIVTGYELPYMFTLLIQFSSNIFWLLKFISMHVFMFTLTKCTLRKWHIILYNVITFELYQSLIANEMIHHITVKVVNWPNKRRTKYLLIKLYIPLSKYLNKNHEYQNINKNLKIIKSTSKTMYKIHLQLPKYPNLCKKDLLITVRSETHFHISEYV